jgi:RNA polymerase sigma-70 factor (ECF subfamily)
MPASDGGECLALTQAVANGDETAAREFFAKYFDRLFRYALVLTRGEEDLSREIVSETMIKAARHIKPMRTDGDVWRWLARIARNSFVDHCRKNQRRISTIPLEGSAGDVRVDADGVLTSALNECLAELADEERKLVEQFYIEDQSQAELAEETHTTRKAVESRLARIRKKLRAAILQKIS